MIRHWVPLTSQSSILEDEMPAKYRKGVENDLDSFNIQPNNLNHKHIESRAPLERTLSITINILTQRYKLYIRMHYVLNLYFHLFFCQCMSATHKQTSWKSYEKRTFIPVSLFVKQSNWINSFVSASLCVFILYECVLASVTRAHSIFSFLQFFFPFFIHFLFHSCRWSCQRNKSV